MKLFIEAVLEVVDFKAKTEDTKMEEAAAVKEEYIMAVVDAEDDTEDAVGIIQVTDGADRMQEWYSKITSHR